MRPSSPFHPRCHAFFPPPTTLSQLLGRAGDVSGFVRRGAESGWVQTTLQEGAGRPAAVIRRTMRRDANTSDWTLNGGWLGQASAGPLFEVRAKLGDSPVRCAAGTGCQASSRRGARPPGGIPPLTLDHSRFLRRAERGAARRAGQGGRLQHPAGQPVPGAACGPPVAARGPRVAAPPPRRRCQRRAWLPLGLQCVSHPPSLPPSPGPFTLSPAPGPPPIHTRHSSCPKTRWRSLRG